MGLRLPGRLPRRSSRGRVTITISVSPEWLHTVNAGVPRQKRSQFLALSGFLALADSSELRQRYRSALEVLLGKARI